MSYNPAPTLLVLTLTPLLAYAGADFSSSVVFATSGKTSYTTPTLIQAGNGDVLAFALRKDEETPRIVVRRSSDGGGTWTEDNELPGKDAKLDSACPLVTSTGKILLLGTTPPPPMAEGRPASLKWLLGNSESARSGGAKIILFESTDNGKNWAETADLTERFWTYPRSGLTRWHGRGLELTEGKQKGRLFFPGYHFSIKSTEPDKDTKSHVIYSDNEGQNWSFGGSTRGFSYEGNIVELGGGKIAFHSQTNWPGYVGFRAFDTSLDAGKTFEVSQKIDAFPELRPTLAGVTRLAAQGAPLLLLANPSSKTDKRFDLTVHASPDDGRSWTIHRVIEKGFAAGSDLLALKDGTVLCLYETDEYRSLKLAKFNRDWIMQ